MAQVSFVSAAAGFGWLGFDALSSLTAASAGGNIPGTSDVSGTKSAFAGPMDSWIVGLGMAFERNGARPAQAYHTRRRNHRVHRPDGIGFVQALTEGAEPCRHEWPRGLAAGR